MAGKHIRIRSSGTQAKVERELRTDTKARVITGPTATADRRYHKLCIAKFNTALRP